MEKILKAFRFKVKPIEVVVVEVVVIIVRVVEVVVVVVVVWIMYCDTNDDDYEYIGAVECRWVIDCDCW